MGAQHYHPPHILSSVRRDLRSSVVAYSGHQPAKAGFYARNHTGNAASSRNERWRMVPPSMRH
jgi:hypothetical protein